MTAQAYARTYQSQSILTANPGQLVLMLYDGALKAIALAQEGFKMSEREYKRIEIINRHIIKAEAIIDELKVTLNHDAGGEFSGTMDRLYDYFLRRLLEANLKKDPVPLAEVERLLREIRDAWAEMLKTNETVATGGALRG